MKSQTNSSSDLTQGMGAPLVNTSVSSSGSAKGSLSNSILELNEQVELDPWWIRFLDLCAAPFSYETGFYFRGKKTFHMRGCGFCTILGGLFLLASSFVLFWPVLSGQTIYSKLETVPFSTPADAPLDSPIPGALSQFFGRKIPREKPMLDLQLFTEQFSTITVYGATACNNSYSDEPQLVCEVEDIPDYIIKAKCR